MKKIKILELGLTEIKDSFISHSSGIWSKVISVSQLDQNSSPITTIFGAIWEIGSDPVTIGGVRIDDVVLGSVNSVEELIFQDTSFYYDVGLQTLYVALPNYAPAWQYKDYKVGEILGFISEAQSQLINNELKPVSTYYGASYYAPRLVSDVSVGESVDDQKNGIFIFEGLDASIENSDGVFDEIRESIVGNEARVLIANISESPEQEAETGFPYKQKADLSDFKVIREGIIEDVDSSDPNEPTISAIDVRADWSGTISDNLLTTAEYPDLESKYESKRKPLLIGQVNGSSCIQLEPTPASASNTDFLICDTSIGQIQTVDGIYFDGKRAGSEVDGFLSPSHYSVDLVTGILTVNSYESGKAWFYGKVTEMDETVEILTFLLDKYAGFAFIRSNFNLDEMEAIKALDYKTHVYVSEKGSELVDVIEKLVLDIQVDFFQQGSVLTMRKGNEQRIGVEDILPEQVFDNPSGWVNDRTDTIKTISVGYNVDHREDLFDTYYDDSKQQEAIDANLKAIDKEFKTNLTDVNQVAEIYDEYYSRFTTPSRTIRINRAIPFTAGLTDFVFFTNQRTLPDGDKIIFERGLYKIVKLDQDKDTAEIVFFEDAPLFDVTGSSDYGIANYGVDNYGG